MGAAVDVGSVGSVIGPQLPLGRFRSNCVSAAEAIGLLPFALDIWVEVIEASTELATATTLPPRALELPVVLPLPEVRAAGWLLGELATCALALPVGPAATFP